MGTFLDTVVEEIREDLRDRKQAVPASELEAAIGPAPRGRPFSEALIGEGISLIAEMKRASPSKGPIRPDASVADIVTAYQQAGARACSVLTEERHFGGSLDDLRRLRDLGLENLRGVVVGRAIYEGRVTIPAALEVLGG